MGTHIGEQTALGAAPAEGDKIPIYDISSSVGRSVTVLNLLKALQAALTSFEVHADNLPNLSGLNGSLNASQIAAADKTGSDADVVTGTAGTDGNAAQWNADGDLVDGKALPTGDIVGTSDSQTITGKTMTHAGNTGAALVPAGAVLPFAMDTAPSGWLECDGSAVSRTTYAALFTAIGTVYGVGDGSTTFNLPDLRGQFVRGWDHGAGTDPNAATRTDSGDGSTTGDNVGTKQADGFEAHVHSTAGDASDALGGTTYVVTSTNGGAAGVNTGSTGGNETRPTNVALMYCIKT